MTRLLSPTQQSRIVLPLIGLVGGLSLQLNHLASTHQLMELRNPKVFLIVGLLTVTFTGLLYVVRGALRRTVRNSRLPEVVLQAFPRCENLGFLPLLLLGLGGFGVRFPAFSAVLFVLAYLLIMGTAICFLVGREQRNKVFLSFQWLAVLFFLSGFAAIMYQIVWQRALFSAFGINIESVTIVVSLFMFGLGIGALAGGLLSRRFPDSAALLFLLCEVAIGLFGLISLALIEWASAVTLDGSVAETSIAIYAVLSLPTIGMGATLPILVGHLNRHYGNVGKSVGVLYFINTFGSALACFMTVELLFALIGLQATVYVAVACNLVVAWLVFRYIRGTTRNRSASAVSDNDEPVPPTAQRTSRLRFTLILILATATGFITLSQEILWFRSISYISGGLPQVFAHLLGFFLGGIALGALFAKWICEERRSQALLFIAGALTLSALVYYFSMPLTAQVLTVSANAGYLTCYVLLGFTALTMGAVFPIACDLAIYSKAAEGFQLSLIYFANIVGSMAGPLLTGFVLLNLYSLEDNFLMLSLATLVLASAVWMMGLRSIPLRYVSAAVIVATGAAMLLTHDYTYLHVLERMHFKSQSAAERPYKYVEQNRSGIIAVQPGSPDIIFGGGEFDGMFNTNPVANQNWITRAYMFAALHPAPAEVLEIGLSSGSWARVVADHAGVRRLTIVEINPGYAKIIRHYSEINTILSDPKVTQVVDDGRRWLNRHPDAKFDFILMNTTFHFRDHVTNLLSAEFLSLCREHLRPAGVLYFNTTDSDHVVRTAALVFRHIVLHGNFVAASDAPFAMNADQKRANLLRFQRNGSPILNPDRPDSNRVLEMLVATDTTDVGEKFRARTELSVITDDNMLTEYKISRKWYDRRAAWIHRFLRRVF